MKTEFKAKFLQHLNKKGDKGFTLIELLVVIIIIGILSAIALPSFLNQANKAKQSEAKQYAGSMNRAQQASFAENGQFLGKVEELGLGIRTQTTNYKYTIEPAGVDKTTSTVGNLASSEVQSLKAYIGVVSLIKQAGATESTSTAVLCEKQTAAVFTPTIAGAVDNAPDNLSCKNDANYTIVAK